MEMALGELRDFDDGPAETSWSSHVHRCSTCHAPQVSLCLPVHNGADAVVESLEHLSRLDYAGILHVFCVANGCSDDTAERARRLVPLFKDRGWELSVLELEKAGKSASLRLGEAAAPDGLFGAIDVNIRPALDSLHHMVGALSSGELSVVSAQQRYVESGSAVVRRFARAYRCAPFARSSDVKGTFLLFADRHRGAVKQMPNLGADDRYFALTARRTERASIRAAAVDYYFPATLGSLVRQQIRWKRNNQVADAAVQASDAPGHEGNRWPYFEPMPPLSSVAVYGAVTVVATVVARLRPRDMPAWRR